MKKFKVSRVYATRWTWTVEAENDSDALAQLDDDDKTWVMNADEEWLGPVGEVALKGNVSDEVEEIKE